MWHCPWNWNNRLPNQSKWCLMCVTPPSAEQFLCINSRYSRKFLIRLISIFHCPLISPGPNAPHFYRGTQQLQISAVSSRHRDWCGVNENDQANTFFLITNVSKFPPGYRSVQIKVSENGHEIASFQWNCICVSTRESILLLLNAAKTKELMR